MQSRDASPREPAFSEAEYAGLFGLDVAMATIQAWADNCRAKKVAVWGRGKGCEQLLALLAANNICVDAVYDRNVEIGHFRGFDLRDESSFRPRDVGGIVVGTLSPGVAEDICNDLRSRFSDFPVVSTVPWHQARDDENSSSARQSQYVFKRYATAHASKHLSPAPTS